MNRQPYENLSDLALLELAIFREARGEPFEGKRGVAHVIRNRVYGETHWWGTDWHSVILKPWQFSSFNADDPNAGIWPADTDIAFTDCCAAAIHIFNGADEDLTDGATFYHDTSMGWPKTWGDPRNYQNMLNVGRLKFFKLLPASNHVAVQEAANEEN